MRNKSIEEKQLSKKLFDLENISAEISIELDYIFKELERKGKWDEFMSNLDKIQPSRKFIHTCVSPENYYECLHFAFDMMSKYDELRDQIESASAEADLLKGRGMECVEMPADALNILQSLGICIEDGSSDTTPIRNEKYHERIALYQLKSRRVLRLMEKALDTLRKSKRYIFSKY
jgi:hypothetical protein